MALTFHDVMTTDLTTLRTASEEWKEMGDKFGKLKTTYDRRVRGVLGKGHWVGDGFDAAAALGNVTAWEFHAAKREAHAVAEMLGEAYRELKKLKKALEDLVKDAKKDGYQVDPQSGRVTVDWNAEKWADMTPEQIRAVKKDPGAVSAAEDKWTQTLKDQVKEIDRADFGYRVALERVTKDVDGKGVQGGFNGQAQGDPEKYEAQRAGELGTKLADGDDLSKKELAEFRTLLKGNEDDRVFSRTFLDGLGADKSVELSKRLQELGYERDGSTKTEILALEKSFGRTVSTATEVPGDIAKVPPGSPEYKAWLNTADGRFYDRWMNGLRKAGMKNYGSNTDPVYGYQPFASMLRNSGAKFDDHFLYRLGGDIIDAEKNEKSKGDIWTEWNGGSPGVDNDPLDTVLDVMGKQPDAATAFLDPKGGQGLDNDHLKYLIEDRRWPQGVLNGMYTVQEVKDPTSQAGFARALEAAATGHPPGEDTTLGGHRADQARVAHQAIESFVKNGNAQDLPENLREPMGRILKDYTPDTHQILSKDNHDYNTKNGVWKDDVGVNMSVPKKHLVEIMRGVADDPKAFGEMYRAERQYSLDAFSRMPDNTGRITETTVQEASAAMGAYDGVRADVIFDDKYKKTVWSADFNHAASLTSVGLDFTPTKYIPLADGAYRVVDFVSYEANKDRVAEAALEATKKNSEQFTAGQREVDGMVVEWAKKHGHEPGDKDKFVEALIGAGQTKHGEGRYEALIHLRPDMG
ncbi:DUF6571 family protein [Streptomyces boncukensis]|uniref:DUF6571 domain-containing protein n=1 Tax=Streptomyces boncukensis TaxID=2711219 RepID=A0A6G4WVB6_9ACTN|nr:DUF6571 family protein [Streptomyces boncukensis]NGO69229.1 hypothetical protein [Streptomyces boncukensis]